MTCLLFTLFPFNPSFLIITHLILFLAFLLMNPYLYFKSPYQSYPYVLLFFPFLYSRLMCFVTLLSVNTVNNKKYSNAENWGKIPGIFNYFKDILKWKMFRIYKLFLTYSVPEK